MRALTDYAQTMDWFGPPLIERNGETDKLGMHIGWHMNSLSAYSKWWDKWARTGDMSSCHFVQTASLDNGPKLAILIKFGLLLNWIKFFKKCINNGQTNHYSNHWLTPCTRTTSLHACRDETSQSTDIFGGGGCSSGCVEGPRAWEWWWWCGSCRGSRWVSGKKNPSEWVSLVATIEILIESEFGVQVWFWFSPTLTWMVNLWNNFHVVVVGAEGELQLGPDPKFPRLQLAEEDSNQVQVWECVNGESVRVSPEWESVWINEWMGKFYSGINCCLLTIILNKLCND